jgi:hypothetical protein
VYQYAVENNGILPVMITAAPTHIGTGGGLINLGSILVPTYIAAIPHDPSPPATDADTNYVVSKNAEGRLILTATSELNPLVPITVTR